MIAMEHMLLKDILMATRHAHAQWVGTIKGGSGTVGVESGTFKGPYSFASRFDRGSGTNPEELLGAAHASCFAMALSLALSSAGFTPDRIVVTAAVTVAPQGGGFKITNSHLVCEATVPAIERDAFMRYAEAAKAGCPVSQALAGTTITLEATLVAERR